MHTPAAVLFVWLRLVLAVGIIGGAAWLVREWHRDLPVTVETRSVDRDGVERITQRTLSPVERISQWRPHWDSPTAKLAGGLALLLLSIGGRWVNPRLWLKAGEPTPRLSGGRPLQLQRPDGTQIFVEIFGPADGPTVVATHGWGTDRQEWAYFRKQCPKLKLVVWDLPGSGRSTRPENDDYSLEKFAQDLRAVLEISGENPVTLLGHSIGGMTTLTLCRLFPELLGTRISGIVLVHTTYRNPLRTMPMSGLWTVLEKPVVVPLLYLQIWLSPLIWLSNCLSYFNGSMHWSNTRTGFAGGESRAKLDFVSRYSLDASPAVLARGCLGMLAYDARQTLPTISVPVLVIGGDKDPVTPQRASEFIAEHTPSAQLRVLKPAKHYGFMEKESEFGELVSQFCHRSQKALLQTG
jgi:pimeloyl-ACP methyl ester carboxylesterase